MNKNIFVTRDNMEAVFIELGLHTSFSINVKTEGLDCLLGVVVSTYKNNFYFGIDGNPLSLARQFRPFLDNVDNTFFAKNVPLVKHFLGALNPKIKFKSKMVQISDNECSMLSNEVTFQIGATSSAS